MFYEPPEWPAQPEWWDVYRGTKLAGEMLASFELLHVRTFSSVTPEVTVMIYF